MPNGVVGIIVDGSTKNTELTIDLLPHPIRQGYAHSYAYGMSGETHILNIGQITVNSGSIGAIDGFQTANLSGPLVASGTTTVNRIAFNAINPGASIFVGGTLNTLDVLQGITLNTGTNSSIVIGGNLNLLNVGQDINLYNGSQILVGRDLGAVLQPPKGTGTGSDVLSLNLPATTTLVAAAPENAVSTYIQGNLNIGTGSTFTVVGNLDQQMYIGGALMGSTGLHITGQRVSPPVVVTSPPVLATGLTGIFAYAIAPVNALGGYTPAFTQPPFVFGGQPGSNALVPGTPPPTTGVPPTISI